MIVVCKTFNLVYHKIDHKLLCIQAANYEGDCWFVEQMEDGGVRAVGWGSEIRMPSWLTIQ